VEKERTQGEVVFVKLKVIPETERLALLNVVFFDRLHWADFSWIEAARTSSGDPGKFLWRPNGAE